MSPKWLGWHLFVILAVTGMLALGDWQLHRAEAGNALSWAYTFEWPLFSIFAIVFWIKTIRDEVHPPATGAVPASDRLPASVPAGGASAGGTAPPDGTPATEQDEELAAYNAYLERLHQEVKGHGKWHGLR